MDAKIKVYGKAQNRTALGILHAYLRLNPKAGLAELRAAFPNSLCPDAGVKQLFLPVAEAETFNANISLYFTKPDEVLTLSDGTDIAFAQVWSKTSLENLIERAKGYGIEVAEVSKTGTFEKGGYRLEYINGYAPAAKKESKSSMWWLWILIALLILGALWFFLGKTKAPEPQIIEKEVIKEVIVEKEVIVRDTVYVQQIEEIENAFNAAQFEQGKADLNDDAKLALHDLARVMKQNPELRLTIEGHTSIEGDATANQVLSEKRAQAAVDFLVQREGIEIDRLKAIGRGSSMPKDSTNLEANRRTEFLIEG